MEPLDFRRVEQISELAEALWAAVRENDPLDIILGTEDEFEEPTLMIGCGDYYLFEEDGPDGPVWVLETAVNPEYDDLPHDVADAEVGRFATITEAAKGIVLAIVGRIVDQAIKRRGVEEGDPDG